MEERTDSNQEGPSKAWEEDQRVHRYLLRGFCMPEAAAVNMAVLELRV